MSVNHISARVSILKLLKVDLIVNDVHIDGWISGASQL
jgi:hypothetical protein